MSPIVAEVYGPDYPGQIAVAKQVRAAFEGTADIVGVDDTIAALFEHAGNGAFARARLARQADDRYSQSSTTSNPAALRSRL